VTDRESASASDLFLGGIEQISRAIRAVKKTANESPLQATEAVRRQQEEHEERKRRISPAAPESADIYDFLYVDRARVSALYAQLFPQGILTTVKTSGLM
jgi:hypothetical protein